MIVALAGRRVDAPDAKTPRFPLENMEKVRERIKERLTECKATALVCSGACGADLLALDVAGELNLRRRIILPFDLKRFRKSSVTDRPGEWGDLFDKVSREVEAVGDFVVLQNIVEEDDAYDAVNKAILDEAIALARHDDGHGINGENNSSSLEEQVLAVIVWNGAARGKEDLTAMFAQAARERGLRIAEILTL